MILVIDNYDSFTFNLVQAMGKLGASMCVRRNDQITPADVLELRPDAVVFSPGPGRPDVAGNMPEILAACMGRSPIFGVCLGMQMIGLQFGGKIVEAKALVHGKAVEVTHDGRTIYHGLRNPLVAGRYHSLAVEDSTLPDCLEVTARSPDGEVMGLRHRSLPIEGVQFHPESILTPEGELLLVNVLRWMAERIPPGPNAQVISR